MTFPELQIQFDLNPDNRVNVLKNAYTCRKISIGYLFVDSDDGQCYLFDKDGQEDDISKVKKIEYNTFVNCKSLAKIRITNSVEIIGNCAFWGCSSLTSIKISDSVKYIGNYAFVNCMSLIKIKIPSSTKSIGDWAFDGCVSLTSIKISNSVKCIGEGAFEDCPSLKEIIFEGKTIDQVKAMNGYPWRIIDELVIKAKS